MKRVLVVEDELLLRALIRQVLQRAGHDVVEARNDSQACRLVHQGGAFDLVITDLVMPGLDGQAVIRRFRQQCPRARIIALSGWGRAGGVEDGLTSAAACGADLFLEKPIGAAELLARVTDLLDGVPA
jgi:two-component system cell cycle sensor histidine kinase/response regulator CckA